VRSITYSIAPEVFNTFPTYIRGVVLAVDVANSDSPAELVRLLRDEEKSIQQRITMEDLISHPRVAAWREAFRSLGIKPSEYRASIEAMARRILRNNELPSINALVDIGNILSLRHLVPTGGHALDDIRGNVELKRASGMEDFIPFGSQELEHPDPGEYVFVEGNTVLTRRWSWRQANHSMTLLSTKIIEFNVDGLPPVMCADVELICREMTELIRKYCGGEVSYQLLTKDCPSIILEW